MLTYTYITPKQEQKEIRIQLLNYYFIERWTDYLKRISAKCPNIDWYVCGLNGCSTRSKEANVADLLRIRDCLIFVNNNNLEAYGAEIGEIERLIAYPAEVQQYHLNDWHRIFTTLEYRFLKIEEKVPDHVNPEELWRVIQDINTYTHHLELWTYIRLPRRQEFVNARQYSVQFTNANNLKYLKEENNVFGQENIEFIPPGGFDFFIQDYNATVWLHEDITGKDQMKAWLDHDDLEEFDVTGNLLMTPSVTLDPYRMYSTILNKPKFREKSKYCNKPLDRYPLGNIINLDDIDWTEFLNSKIHNISLYDQELWNTQTSAIRRKLMEHENSVQITGNSSA